MVRPGEQERVFVGDEYRVHRDIDVELRIQRLGSGKLTLAPQILCSLPRADTTLRSFATPDTGLYILSTRLDSARTYLTFNVERGGAFVEWNRGSPTLFVVAGGHVTRVDSTEIIIAVADPGRLAFLYVREGTVSFPSAVELAARRNELWELRPDEVPRRLAMPPGELSRMVERELSHHLGSVGIPPPRDPGARRFSWRRPTAYLIAGGLATAAIVRWCCRSSPSPSPRRHTGTAVVHIPL
jgi:hypothetical protein